MGRIAGSLKQIVELKRVIQDLRCVAEELARDFPNTRWYLFGSLLRQKSLPSDIDLLIVYQADYEARGLRIGLDALCGCLPIDLLLLREDEESELNFVSGQSAMCIFPFEPFN
jgi:predicted nucleotidyltransferase